MSEQQKSGESSRNLLEQMEGEWDLPKPGSGAEKDLHAHLDAAADRLVESLDPPPVSVPRMDELDGGWDDEDEDDEEEEDDEPELPDERLDPVAYAVAKKARDERMEAKRQRRRVKAEAKKARRKARVDAQKQKQKGKTKKARAPQAPERPTKKERRAALAKPARVRTDGDEDSGIDSSASDDAEVIDVPRSRKPSPNRIAKKSLLSGTNQWMLAVAVLIFVAAAIFAAVVAR